jgi:hypothetical protein
MNLAAFLDLLDRHGPEVADWPPEQRESMQAFVHESAEAARQLGLASRIRHELASLPHAVTPGLQGRILALAAASQPSPADRFLAWLTTTLWRPALLSVVPLALGAMLGMNLPRGDDASWNITGLLLDEVYTSYE